MIRRLLPLFVGVFAAALAAGGGFGFRRAQLIAEAAADTVAPAGGPAADSAAGAARSDTSGTGGALHAPAHGDPSGADSLHADSTRRAYVLGASDDPAGAARAAAAAEVGLAAGSTDTAAAAPTATAPARPTGDDATPPVSVRRLAKIFGTMAPRDAARVLAQLGDEDVQTLIAHLSDRQAAALMGSITPERAARITGNTLRIARETP